MEITINWNKEHILFKNNQILAGSEDPDVNEMRIEIEPWLTAILQSEHLSLLLGTGITNGICMDAEVKPRSMERISFEFSNSGEKIAAHANVEAKRLGRGSANIEDDLRAAIDLLRGVNILDPEKAGELKKEIDDRLRELVTDVLKNERSFLQAPKKDSSLSILERFLISFSSRTSSRDRLHIFTTNYDRFIEYALDNAGIYVLDRFVGKLDPIMRMHKLELDYHYNPPGIRGEPRYVDGVVRYTKMHGSLDWKMEEKNIRRMPLSFGSEVDEGYFADPYDALVIYPNSSKGIETAYFPYSELFRDFSTAISRPNSALVIYGYGFGDSHINSIIHDMMTLPSTHLVIISYDKAGGRIQRFVEHCNPSQLTLMIGPHYGNIRTLTENYLPKSSIDRISDRFYKIQEKRRTTSAVEEVQDGSTL